MTSSHHLDLIFVFQMIFLFASVTLRFDLHELGRSTCVDDPFVHLLTRSDASAELRPTYLLRRLLLFLLFDWPSSGLFSETSRRLASDFVFLTRAAAFKLCFGQNSSRVSLLGVVVFSWLISGGPPTHPTSCFSRALHSLLNLLAFLLEASARGPGGAEWRPRRSQVLRLQRPPP